MDSNVTTIFLSMALTIAFTQLVSAQPAPLSVWILFFYFCFRKCSYYASDVRFNQLSTKIFKKENISERFLHFTFGISTLFLFVVTGYFITEPCKFFLFTALALVINIMWLIMLLLLIDPTFDNNPKLTIRQMFKNFIVINVIEIFICVIGGLWLACKWKWDGMVYMAIQPWVFSLSVGLLVFVMFVDILLHKYFLFDPDYKCEP